MHATAPAVWLLPTAPVTAALPAHAQLPCDDVRFISCLEDTIVGSVRGFYFLLGRPRSVRYLLAWMSPAYYPSRLPLYRMHRLRRTRLCAAQRRCRLYRLCRLVRSASIPER